MLHSALVASLALFASTAHGVDSPAPQSVDHVFLISVDGLRADMLEPPIVALLPNLARLLHGPHTLSARTDAQYTITLPNHLCMLTGRPVLGPYGHGWTANDEPRSANDGGTLHIHKGAYITSVFDVAHDAGVSTGCIANKQKFWLLQQSYGWLHGARDTTGVDNGPAKIDFFLFSDDMRELIGAVVDRAKRSSKRTLDFVHLAAPDIAGHSYDWQVDPGTPYFESVRAVDRALGVLLQGIDGDDRLCGHSAIVLTADHGGGVPRKTHTDITCPLNFRIPFAVWLGDSQPASDLYELNGDRRNPSREEIVGRDDSKQPIRSGDAANVALSLLGLGPIPGSFYGTSDGPAPRLRLHAESITENSSSK